jgi:hypothetical protein
MHELTKMGCFMSHAFFFFLCILSFTLTNTYQDLKIPSRKNLETASKASCLTKIKKPLDTLNVIKFTINRGFKLTGTSIMFLATDPEARVRFPALPEKKSSGSGTGSTQPREYN